MNNQPTEKPDERVEIKPDTTPINPEIEVIEPVEATTPSEPEPSKEGFFSKWAKARAQRSKEIKKSKRKNKTASEKRAIREQEFFKKSTKGDALAFYFSVKRKHILYGVTSGIMSLMFYMHFTSPDWLVTFFKGWDSVDKALFGVSWGAFIWAMVGLLFAITLTILIMHSHAIDKKGFTISKWIAYALLALSGLAFNIFTEVASTMERAEEGVKIRSAKSPLAKKLMEGVGKGSSSDPQMAKYISDIARWEANVQNRCDRRIGGRKNQNYNKKHCSINTAKLSGAKIAMKLHQQNFMSESANNMKLAKDSLHDTDNAQMIIKLLVDITKNKDGKGLSFIYSAGVISAFMILTFELFGMMIGAEYARAKIFLVMKGIDLHGDYALSYLKVELKRKIKTNKEKLTYRTTERKAEIANVKATAQAQAEIMREKTKAARIIMEAKKQQADDMAELMADMGDMADAGQPQQLEQPQRHNIGFIHESASQAMQAISASTGGSHMVDSMIGGSTESFGSGSSPTIDSLPMVDTGTLSVDEMLDRRETAKANRSLHGNCPACSMDFDKPNAQTVFCHPIHTKLFNNELKRKRKLGK